VYYIYRMVVLSCTIVYIYNDTFPRIDIIITLGFIRELVNSMKHINSLLHTLYIMLIGFMY